MGRGRPPLNRVCEVTDCGRPHRARGLCTMHWKREHGTRGSYTITCVVCGEAHQSARRDGKFCSDACRAVDYQGREWTTTGFDRRARAARKLWAAARGSRGRAPWVAGRCPHCGAPFVSRRFGGLGEAHFCSRKCKGYAVAASRRARKRGSASEPYSRQGIFERDGWRCHICRRLVRRSAAVPHPLAPTIDHLIPIARGGPDTPANVATAHFLCNSTKSDRGGCEQLALIG